jgi:di/tricarboxylate transporter
MDVVSILFIVALLFLIYLILKAVSKDNLIKKSRNGLFKRGVPYRKLSDSQKGIVRYSLYILIIEELVFLFLTLNSLIFYKSLLFFCLGLFLMVFLVVLAWQFIKKKNWQGMYQYFYPYDWIRPY